MDTILHHELLPPALAIVVATLMRLVVAWYYSDSLRMLRHLKLAPRPAGVRTTKYKRWDHWLAPLPFLWTWLDIVTAVLLADYFANPLGWLLLMIWVGGRFRALQEFGHNAVHYALCPNRQFQWWLADFFYQFPSFKRDMKNRKVIHWDLHHTHPNDQTSDPNRIRVCDGGMVFGMNRFQFYLCLFFPLSPRGIRTNVLTMWRNSLINDNLQTVLNRILSVCLTAAVLYLAGGWQGVVFGWLVPLVTTYQLFAWWALLAEHRWLIPESSTDREEQEYIAGRPTDYPGFSGWLVRMFISPTSDAYHLAHSLYPTIRWNYLPAIDHALKIKDPRYTQHASEGFLIQSRENVPSALSELRDRLTARPVAETTGAGPEATAT